jgi:hypothetical protein
MLLKSPSALKEPLGDFRGLVGVFISPLLVAPRFSDVGGSDIENPCPEDENCEEGVTPFGETSGGEFFVIVESFLVVVLWRQ